MRIIVAMLLLAIPSAAFAEDTTISAPAANADTIRLRADLAGGVTAGFARTSQVNANVLGPGITLDLGAQLGDPLALYLRGELYSVYALDRAAAYGVFEWTPRAWLSLGTGI